MKIPNAWTVNRAGLGLDGHAGLFGSGTALACQTTEPLMFACG